MANNSKTKPNKINSKPVSKKIVQPVNAIPVKKSDSGEAALDLNENFWFDNDCNCPGCPNKEHVDIQLTAVNIPCEEIIQHASIVPDKVYNFGERGSGIHSKFPVQDYNIIKAECLKKGELFMDNTFNADLTFYFDARYVKWLRPKEISLIRGGNPKFMEKVSRFSVKQQVLGDCWMLAAMAVLTLSDTHVVEVIPPGQSFDKDYAGIFHFRLWYYGRWIDVCVDDRLPCVDRKLIFNTSNNKNEYWSALLEKAYAKLLGNYGQLEGGLSIDALETFTGGCAYMLLTENYRIQDFVKILKQAYARGSLICASIYRDPGATGETETSEGLAKGHAYSVTKMVNLEYTDRRTGKTEIVFLIRIRNPWGSTLEWNRAWSDRSPEWKSVSEQTKKEIGLVIKNDGEFWMDFRDVYTRFQMFEICHFTPEVICESNMKKAQKKWHVEQYDGEWLPGVSDGGGIVRENAGNGNISIRLGETMHLNPQYTIVLDVADDDDKFCKIVIELFQKKSHGQKKFDRMSMLVCPIADPESAPKPLTQYYLERNFIAAYDITRGLYFTGLRKLANTLSLKPGTYCIIPMTKLRNVKREFFLRIFSEHSSHLKEFDMEVKGKNVLKDVVHVPVFEKGYFEVEDVKNMYKGMIGSNGEVSWFNLQKVLNQILRTDLRGHEISKNTCQSLVALFDDDYSGSLSYEEFAHLIDILWLIKQSFNLFDEENRGLIKSAHLNQIFVSLDMPINKHLLQLMIRRFGNLNNEIQFDDFLMCFIKMEINSIKFNSMSNAENKIKINQEEWLKLSLYS